MRRIGLRIGCAICGVLVAVVTAEAQNTPTVLIHGIASNASTWNATAQRLSSDFAVDVFRRDTDSFDSFEAQSSQVAASFGNLPGSTIAIGHSNGGMVARVWGGSRPFGGVLTVGTPNRGAPLVANAYFAAQDGAELVESIYRVFGAVSACPGGCNWLGIWAGLVDNATVTATLADYAMATLLTRVIPVAGAVGGEMLPGSAFLQNVNSTTHLLQEQATATRIGIVSEAHNWPSGGWLRAAFGEDADWIVPLRDAVAIGMDGLAWTILLTADPGDSDSQDLGYTLLDASWNLSAMDYEWCRNVSEPWYSALYGLCEPNDTIVPTWSQDLPWGIKLDVNDGPVHLEETDSWNLYGSRLYDRIHQAMEEFLRVPPAGTTGGSGEGTTGGDDGSGSGAGSGGDDDGGETGGTGGHTSTSFAAMTGDAAVRGCTNYVEWPPVFQATASDCVHYCASAGADACEWNEAGSCYVEFGAGCYVQGGFSGWYAAVAEHTGSPDSVPEPGVDLAEAGTDSRMVERQ